MKKSHMEEKTIEVEVIDDILCNKCGQSCSRDDGHHQGLLEHKIRGGYGSLLGDGDEYTFSLCEACLLRLFATFKIKVERFERFDDDM